MEQYDKACKKWERRIQAEHLVQKPPVFTATSYDSDGDRMGVPFVTLDSNIMYKLLRFLAPTEPSIYAVYRPWAWYSSLHGIVSKKQLAVVAFERQRVCI